MGLEDVFQFLLGKQLPGQARLRNSQGAAELLHRPAAITTEHPQPQPHGMQGGQSAARIGPGLIVHGHKAQQLLPLSHRQHRGPLLPLLLLPAAPRLSHGHALSLQPRGAAHPAAHAIQQPPPHALPRLAAAVIQGQQRQLALLGLLQQGMGQGMAALGLEAGGDLDEPIGTGSARFQGGHQRTPQGEGAGFIEQQGVQAGGGFDRITAAEQHTGLGGTARAHGDGRWGGQAQGAGTGHHQHGNAELQGQGQGRFCAHAQALMAAVQMGRRGSRQHLGPQQRSPAPPEQEGGRSQGQYRQGEAPGHPIGQALDRGLAGLGLLHQVNDAGHGALGTWAQHFHGEGPIEIEAARRQLRAGLRLQRQRFAREARDIHAGEALQHKAIHRHPVAGQQPHPIPRPQGTHPHGTGGHLRIRRIAQQQQRGIGLQLCQLLQGAAGTTAGPLLQEPPQQHEAQQHHRLIEEALPAHRGPDEGHQAGQIGAAHAQTHQGVHARHTRQGRTGPTHQDRTTRAGQGQGGHQGMQADVCQGRERQRTCLSQVPQHRHQQQAQGHHQLAPVLPPTAPLLPLRRAEGQALLVAAAGCKAEARQGRDQGRCWIDGRPSQQLRIEADPGRAGEQVHAGLADAGLGQQPLLHGPDTATAFHTLHLQQQRSHGTGRRRSQRAGQQGLSG